MDEKKYHGTLNLQPELCPVCGARHEAEYPHLDTARFRLHVFREKGRAATQYDLLAHTKGMIRETVMVATLQAMRMQ